MSIISHILNQEASIITVTTAKHGDQVGSTESTVPCRFRYVTEVDKSVNREEIGTADAIVWLETDSGVAEGDILKVEDLYWRVDKLVRARKMSGGTIEFLKAYVKKHELVEQ